MLASLELVKKLPIVAEAIDFACLDFSSLPVEQPIVSMSLTSTTRWLLINLSLTALPFIQRLDWCAFRKDHSPSHQS